MKNKSKGPQIIIAGSNGDFNQKMRQMVKEKMGADAQVITGMPVKRISQISGKENTMYLDVTQAQLDRYASGEEHVQNVFPHLNAAQREFIKSGITPTEWEAMFGKMEEEDPNDPGTWTTIELFSFLITMKVISDDEKFEEWKHDRTDMLAMVKKALDDIPKDKNEEKAF